MKLAKSKFWFEGINQYIENYDASKSGQLRPGSINVDESFEDSGKPKSGLSRHIETNVLVKTGTKKLSQIALSNSARLHSLIVQVLKEKSNRFHFMTTKITFWIVLQRKKVVPSGEYLIQNCCELPKGAI